MVIVTSTEKRVMRQAKIHNNRCLSRSAKEPGSSVIYIHFYTRIRWSGFRIPKFHKMAAGIFHSPGKRTCNQFKHLKITTFRSMQVIEAQITENLEFKENRPIDIAISRSCYK